MTESLLCCQLYMATSSRPTLQSRRSFADHHFNADDGGNDGSSSISISSSATLSASSSITIPLKDLPTSTTSLPDIPNQDGTTSISTPDKDITTSTSLSAKDDKSSSSSSSGYQSYSSPVGFSYGTGVSAPSGTTQEIVTTEV